MTLPLTSESSTVLTWHAKCVLVDEDVAFVTSANFTEWAQQRNVEAGVLLRNRHFAGQLRQQFEGLIHRSRCADCQDSDYRALQHLQVVPQRQHLELESLGVR